MIISFSGVPGAGKSTIAKMLAQKLGWPRYYMGGLRRQKAKERGMTLEEYNKLGETDPSTDLEVDRYQEKLGKEKDDFIIEGRTSWYFIPHSLKIYLDVDLNKGSERIYWQLKDKNNNKNGKKALIGAVIGLVIIFSSYIIVNFTAQSLGAIKEGGDILNTDWNK